MGALDPPSGILTDPQTPVPIEVPGQTLEPGRVLGKRYEVRGRLGAGGMGQVYRVYDLEMSEEIALKVVSTEELDAPQAIERLREEAKSARRIRHRNVCNIFDCGEADGITFLTMQLIDGPNLRALLRKGPVPTERVLKIVKQVAAGLSEVHHEGVIHRDIKPENIVLRSDGEPVLVDFGLAHYVTAHRRTGTIAGTPAYMSPEQLRGDILDARSDIFAFGVLAYELFAGRSPFDRGGPTATADAIKHDPPAPFEAPSLDENTQANVERVLFRALEKSPAARFASALDFATELEAAVSVKPSSEVVSVEMAPASQTVFPKRSRSSWRFRSIGLTALIVLGFAVMLLARPWAKRTSRPERPVVVLAPVKNLTHDASHDVLSSSASDAARTALLRLPEIDVTAASSDTEARAAVLDGRAYWALGGSLQMSDGLGLVAQFERAGNAVGNEINVQDKSKGNVGALLDQFKWRVLDEAWLLVRENARYRTAEVGTGNDGARQKLVRYYHDHYVNIVSGEASRENIDQAKRLLDQAIDEDPEYVQAFVERAYLRAKVGEFESARSDIERAVVIDPKSASARIMHCRVLQRVMQENESAADDDAVNEALQACQRALEVAPSSADVHLVFARLHNLRCDDGAAMTSLHEAKEKDRGQTGRALAHYLQLALDNEDWVRADEASMQLLQFEEEQRRLAPQSMIARLGIPPELDAPLLRAVVLLHDGKNDEARIELEKQLAWLVQGNPNPIWEAVVIRSLLYRIPNPSSETVKKYEPLLLQHERTIRDEIVREPATAADVAWYYQWIDPAKAVEWIELAKVSNVSKEPVSCSISLRIAGLYKAAGEPEKARTAAASCKPRFEWEQSCLAWVQKRLSR